MRYTYRQRPVAVLVSSSGDGLLVGRVIERLAGGVLWGSSTRGGIEGLRGVLRAAANDRRPRPASPIFTLDGPRGPRHVAKPGALAAARATGLPIVPVTVAFGRCLVLARSWDRFVIPCPGTSARVIYGDPVWVRRGDDEAERLAALQGGMDRVTAAAEARGWATVIGQPRRP